MDSNLKILIIYHSGAGSTKTIAEIYYKMLVSYDVKIVPIGLEFNYSSMEEYDFFVFAFPTYHCEPSSSMQDFIKNMPPLITGKRAFVFTTCGLYTGNTIRIFYKECLRKNIIICGHSEYRAPATDGVLMFPRLEMLYNYEKNIAGRIIEDIKSLKDIIEKNINITKYPPFKFYSILNYPNKRLGKSYKHKIKIIKELCIECGKCIDNCVRGCFEKDETNLKINNKKCEFCFRCIHHCPTEAIILSSTTRKKQKLNKDYYDRLKEKIISEI